MVSSLPDALLRWLRDDRADARAVGTAPPAAEAQCTASQVLSLVAGCDAATIERIIQELEGTRARVVLDGAEGRRLADVLDVMRPLVRRSGVARTPTLSRLAWAPIEVLFSNGEDARPWSIDRVWLPPAWDICLLREPRRAKALTRGYADVLARSEGRPPVAAITEVAAAAQGLLRVALGGILADDAFFVDNANRVLPAAMRSIPQAMPTFRDALSRAVAAITAKSVATVPFDTLVNLIKMMLFRGAWREGPDLDQALFELGRALQQLSDLPIGKGVMHGPGQAFLVMLGRSVPFPWPLLEIVRHRSLMLKPDERPVDMRAPAEIVPFADDLAGTTQMLAARVVRQVETLRNSAYPEEVLGAATALATLGSWYRRVEAAGYYEHRGVRYLLMTAHRQQIGGLLHELLLPLLRGLILAPFTRGRGGAADGAVLLQHVLGAAAALHALGEVGDGLRCKALLASAQATVLRKINAETENVISAAGSGNAAPQEKRDAVVALLDILAPAAAAQVRQRLHILEHGSARGNVAA